ncbi:carbohydrate-binding module family 50 protein, partial [Saccharata proteae CBS 121410]
SSSATVPAPTSTMSGTTNSCYQWHTQQSGDTCYSIEQQYSITDAYFRSLNPEIDANCYNLALGYAYCVSGAASPYTTTVSGTTNSCYQWHTQQSGDTCYSIEQQYSITDAYFRSLNPEIDANCYNLALGYAYCVSGS